MLSLVFQVFHHLVCSFPTAVFLCCPPMLFRCFPPEVFHGFPNQSVPWFSTRVCPWVSAQNNAAWCSTFFPCLWQGVSMVFHQCFSMVFHQCFSMVFHQGFCVVFQQLHFRSLPRNSNTLKWLGSVWIPFHIELHIGFNISFHQDILYHQYRATKGPLMVAINGYKEHIAAMNPLIHIASVPPYCASHFWPSQQLFWNISVSRGSFPSESGRWRKTPAISRQVIPPIGKCSPGRGQAARMSHPGNST